MNSLLPLRTLRTRRAALAALTAVAAACTVAFALPTQAQEPRAGVTRLLVPFVAGGATDLVARLLAQNLGEEWGQVIVENRPGAAGTIASRVVATAPPDGRTLIMVTSGHAINELIYEKLPYSTLGDFSPIAQVTDVPNVLLTGKDSPYKSLADVIAAGKGKPDALQYGTAGAGTSVHLAGELLASMAGVKMTPVHFKGDGESIVALAGNHIPLSINTVPGAKTQVQAGTVRPIAVTGAQRAGVFKDVPTIAEAGVPGYVVSNWFGVLGPAKMDPKLVARLNADIRKAMSDPAVVKKLEDQGITVKTGSPEDFDRLIRTDIGKWKPVIDKLGLRGSNT
jgi:tripartite-type tricarboxylate transporter receptor subunit TctC